MAERITFGKEKVEKLAGKEASHTEWAYPSTLSFAKSENLHLKNV